MSITRRDFMRGAASLAAMAATQRFGFADAVAPPSTNPSPATLAYQQSVPPAQWTELLARLKKTNSDIHMRGLRNFRGSDVKLLTGYPYNEYYDWDLYFENMYLAYYGIWPY